MSQPMPEPRPDLLPAEPQDWELVADAFPGSLLFCDEAWVIQRAHGRADPVGHLDSQHYQGERADELFHPLSNFGPGTNLWTRLRRDGRVDEKVFDSRGHRFFQLSGTRVNDSKLAA